MHFLKKWLRAERPAGVATYAGQTIELALSQRAAYEFCRKAVADVLGGTVQETGANQSYLEARFGLVNSERLSIEVEPLDEGRSRVRVQARRGAGAHAAPESPYVKALCVYLINSASK